MALILQDDTGTVADANTYVLLQAYKDYWTTRNIDVTNGGAYTDLQLEADLIIGREYADDLHQYQGSKLNGREQTTEFPRTGLYDCEGTEITGIPFEMQNAQMEYAKLISVDGLTLQPNENTGGSIKREKSKVDVIEEEIEYFNAGQTGGVISYPAADKKIPSYFYGNSSDEGLMSHA